MADRTALTSGERAVDADIGRAGALDGGLESSHEGALPSGRVLIETLGVGIPSSPTSPDP